MAITASASGGTRAWSDVATWVGGVVPGAGDDVLLASTSGPVTITAAASCLTLDCTGYASTLTHNAACLLTVAGTLFKLVPGGAGGMTYTLGNAATSALAFTKATSGTVLITTGGKTLGNVTTANGLTASSATYQLQDACTIGTAATWTHVAGTFDTNSKACSWGMFVSTGSYTRTVTLGTSVITMTAGGGGTIGWTFYGASNLTFTCGTSAITFTGLQPDFRPGGKTFYDVTWTNMRSCYWASGGTFHNVTVTPEQGSGYISWDHDSNSTITGTLTITGTATYRAWCRNHYPGSPITLTAAAIALSYVDFADVTGAGLPANAAWTGTSMGDCLGNHNITFDTSAPQTWNGNTTGAWSNPANWTSRVPLPQDDVTINALTSGTIALDMPRLGRSISFAGSSGGSLTYSIPITSFGSLSMNSTVGRTGAQNWTLSGRSSHTLASNGFTNWGATVLVTAPGGTYTLTDDFNSVANTSFNLSSGTLDAATHNVAVSITNIATSGGTINMGNGTWTMNRTGLASWSAAAGLTVNAGGSTLVLAASSGNTTFAGGGKSYNNVTLTGGSGGTFTVTGANTFTGTLTLGAKTTYTWPHGVTQTVGSLYAVGSASNVITWVSDTPTSAYTISCAAGHNPTCNYLNLTDSTVTGGALFYAGANSANTARNTGWTFTLYTDTGSGTITSSGATTESKTVTDARSGTITTSGSKTESKTVADTAAGTITSSGAMTESKTVTDASAGTITLSGSTTESRIYPDTCLGTVTLSGANVESRAVTDACSGTVALSGSEAEGKTYTDIVAATVIVSGSKTESKSYSDTCAGSITLVGVADETKAYADTCAGAVTFSGTKVEGKAVADSCAGTLVLTGVVAEWDVDFDACAGTLILSGTVSEALSASDAVDGGLGVLGIAVDAWDTTCAVTGSVVLSGFADEIAGYADLTSGVITLSGNATAWNAYLDTPAGTLTLHGGADEFRSYEDSSLGVVSLSGAASTATRYDDATGGRLTARGSALDRWGNLVFGTMILRGYTRRLVLPLSASLDSNQTFVGMDDPSMIVGCDPPTGYVGMDDPTTIVSLDPPLRS